LELSSLNGGLDHGYFVQQLNHFGYDSRVWNQQYYINSTYYKPGGPIFFQIGGEGPISAEDVTSLQMSVYARQFNALQVTLEHRFYGLSKPFPTLTVIIRIFIQIISYYFLKINKYNYYYLLLFVCMCV
jgi:hypothetical protein